MMDVYRRINMKKLFLIISLLLFLGCSQKDYESMYQENFNPFEIHSNSSAQGKYETIQNGENPMNKPSYDEYRGE